MVAEMSGAGIQASAATACAAAGTGGQDDDLFGFGSRAVLVALVGFAVAYVTVTVGTGLHITSPRRWAGLIVAFGLLVVTARRVVRLPDGRCDRRSAVAAAVAVLAATGISWWSLPAEQYMTLQNGPATAGGIVVLTLVAVRGQPGIAWAGAVAMSVLCGLWGLDRGIGFVSGVTITVWAYPVLVLSALFLLILRPMADQSAELRARSLREAFDAASTEAAADERRRNFEDFEQRARPVLERIAAADEFSSSEIAEMHLLEAQLRDGIRAPDWDTPAIRDAVWAARARGAVVILLDDGALQSLDEDDRASSRDRMARLLLDELAADNERVTARIMPPGRPVAASVVVSSRDCTRRIEMTAEGEVVRSVSGR